MPFKPKPKLPYKTILLKRERAEALIKFLRAYGLRIEAGNGSEMGLGIDALITLAQARPVQFKRLINDLRLRPDKPTRRTGKPAPREPRLANYRLSITTSKSRFTARENAKARRE